MAFQPIAAGLTAPARARGWLWALVSVIGGLLAIVPVVAVVAAAWLSDPEVLVQRGTATDSWPSDASWLGGILLIALPIGFIVGAGAASASYGLGILASGKTNLWWAAAAGGLLTGLISLPAAWLLARVTPAPESTASIVATLAAVAATFLGRPLLALRSRDTATASPDNGAFTESSAALPRSAGI